MIIFKDKNIEINELFPSTNPYGDDVEVLYVVDETTPEGNALAVKIKQCAPYMDFILEGGRLVDVTPTERPPAPAPQPSPDERIAQLETENAELRSRVSDVEPRLGDVEMALADLFTV